MNKAKGKEQIQVRSYKNGISNQEEKCIVIKWVLEYKINHLESFEPGNGGTHL